MSYEVHSLCSGHVNLREREREIYIYVYMQFKVSGGTLQIGGHQNQVWEGMSLTGII